MRLFSHSQLGIFLAFLLGCQTLAAANVCHPTLWPNEKFIVNHPSDTQKEIIKNLQKWAKKSLKAEPQAIPVLASAGKVDKNDPDLLASRLAFRDAERAAVLALAFTVNHNPEYLTKTKDILLNWAAVNQPTGNPIDETRLEGMIWAYDLISCDLSTKEQNLMEVWLEKLRNKKNTWQFGSVTRNNNHRIHQMKMLLLLDKVLHHTQDWKKDLAQTEKYAALNLNSKTGESIDYQQRKALHYHNYDLQAWLEISLVSGCCRAPVTSAFHFLSDRILSHHIDGEFLHSTAKIDGLRDKGGFTYAKSGGAFDVSKAASTIVTYYTIVGDKPLPELWDIVEHGKPSLWLTFVTDRRAFW